ncbi:MAG: UDP-N-acetylmuramoyl-tripeptide--D-alanyl-D-alanine ligase [Clostridia bacterium]|nr:UDP-N-acetylmuramoyl-tripeptide--D-alanyl-D-alanine ligase [Clostridia bacterium]
MWQFENVKSLNDLFTTEYVIFYLLISLVSSGLLLLISYKFLQIMQQSGYEGFGYFKWLRRNDNIYLTRLVIISILSSFSFLILNITFSFSDSWLAFWGSFTFYIVFIIYYWRSEKKRKKKVPIVFTSRMVRLIVAYVILLILINFLLLVLLSIMAFNLRDNPLLIRVRFLPICCLPIGVPFFLLLAYYIMKPYERSHQMNYIRQCKKKLQSRTDLIKIAITGSYGKTSVKNYLCTILQEKYKVFATPASYNTPMGICKSVKRLTDEHQIFIAEMGARRRGDIKELAQIINPEYAIMNGIVGQHMETFGSLSTIQKTKYELVENMSDGVVAYTVDNENTSMLFSDCRLKTRSCGINASKKPSVFAKDISVNSKGSNFTLVIDGKEIKCYTQLLGTHNISNICLASAVAYELGLDLSEISAGISRLTPVNHRLSIIESNKKITVIDDSYNSNPRGFDAALEVLNLFEGRKIVVTPGIVELGVNEYLENYELGKKLVGKCDLVILVGRIGALIIKNGLIEGGFDPEKIIQTATLDQAKKQLNELLLEGDVVLFENDLPDKFA